VGGGPSCSRPTRTTRRGPTLVARSFSSPERPLGPCLPQATQIPDIRYPRYPLLLDSLPCACIFLPVRWGLDRRGCACVCVCVCPQELSPAQMERHIFCLQNSPPFVGWITSPLFAHRPSTAVQIPYAHFGFEKSILPAGVRNLPEGLMPGLWSLLPTSNPSISF